MIYAIIFTLVSISAWIWIDVALKLDKASLNRKVLEAFRGSLDDTYQEVARELEKELSKEFGPKRKRATKKALKKQT